MNIILHQLLLALSFYLPGLLLHGPFLDQEESQDLFEWVESYPKETTLDHPHIRDTGQVWREMIENSSSTIDMAFFYYSNQAGSPLEKIVQLLERKAEGGVKVRLLGEKKFYENYPKTLDRLGEQDNIEFRLMDLESSTGGILHAKYFVVDQREAFVGSQNFDWRALEHIQELGVRIRNDQVAQCLGGVFQQDWENVNRKSHQYSGLPCDVLASFDTKQGSLSISPALSPRSMVSPVKHWDLPKIQKLLQTAKEKIQIQLLTYNAISRDGDYFEDIEKELMEAAHRGVQVHLLVADWGKRSKIIGSLKKIQKVKNMEVRFAVIPPAKEGFVPFARVVHAKYVVVDGKKGWLGTSNWEKGYFFKSRNVGFMLEGPGVKFLSDFFEGTWESKYHEKLDVDKNYKSPRFWEEN